MSTQKISIRKAKLADLRPIYDLEEEYIEEIEPENLARWKAAEINIKAQLQDSLKNIFVAEDENRVVGHCFWELFEGTAQIFSICVTKAYRRKGLASQLMQITESDCQAKGHERIALKTRITNPAQFLFQHLSYTLLEEKEGWVYFEKSLSNTLERTNILSS